jgi:undecaprenyl-diphosphatase
MTAPVSPSRWWLYIGLTAIALLVGSFGMIADEMAEGDTIAFDTAVLHAFRTPGDLNDPIGPPWVEEAVRDLTSLGSFPILTLIVVAVFLELMLSGKRRTALFLVGTVIGGTIVSNVLKALFDRPRPELADTARVFTASFPSGHSVTSAVVYLTIGVLLAGATEQRRLRVFYVTAAILLTLIVGITRLYLGVHYPTDVVAGWAVGTAWALLCWVGYRLWVRSR